VLINLVRNAAESIGQKGSITLRTRQDRLPLKGQPQKVIVLEVQDTGAGIPAEVQERLFDPFFTTKAAGTGLGLSIAMRILERHGGTLQFQTAPGRGTTFGVVLPAPSS
jgi:signal transduction histidine kinase